MPAAQLQFAGVNFQMHLRGKLQDVQLPKTATTWHLQQLVADFLENEKHVSDELQARHMIQWVNSDVELEAFSRVQLSALLMDSEWWAVGCPEALAVYVDPTVQCKQIGELPHGAVVQMMTNRKGRVQCSGQDTHWARLKDTQNSENTLWINFRTDRSIFVAPAAMPDDFVAPDQIEGQEGVSEGEVGVIMPDEAPEESILREAAIALLSTSGAWYTKAELEVTLGLCTLYIVVVVVGKNLSSFWSTCSEHCFNGFSNPPTRLCTAYNHLAVSVYVDRELDFGPPDQLFVCRGRDH